MNKEISKIKIIISLLFAGLLVASAILGIVISDNPLFTSRFVVHNLQYFKYKMLYAGNLASLWSKPAVYEAAENAINVPVLVYHGILDDHDGSNINISSSNFKEHMFALKNEGYRTIKTNELYNFLRGEEELPEKSVLITFDDGREDSFDVADPIFRALDYGATMFTIAKYPEENTDSAYYLTKNDLFFMQNSGRWEVQAHNYDAHDKYVTFPGQRNGHFFSHKFWLSNEKRLESDEEFENRIRDDFSKAKESLEDIFGREVNSFAFPFGDYGQHSTNFSRAKDISISSVADYYNLAFYQNAPGVRFTTNFYDENNKGKTFFLVRRINVEGDWSGKDLIKILSNGEAKKLPYFDDFNTDKGWVKIWGNVELSPQNMTISATGGQTGGTVILDGTRHWKDYSLKARVVSPNKSGVYAWLRYQDDDNNGGCNFGNGFVHVEQIKDGKKNVIRGVRSPDIVIPSGEFEIEARVKGRTVECLLDGQMYVSTQFLDPTLTTGGIGFKTWLEESGQSQISIKNVSVEEIKSE